MRALFERGSRFLDTPLDLTPRILLILAALLLASIYLFPLWNLTIFTPQHSEGLRLDIYSYKLEGGNHGADIKEINTLNRYIGMKGLAAEDFAEFRWMPFVVGVLGLLFLRAAVHGKMASLVDVFVLDLYFSVFALSSFAYKLHSYGHDLSPGAPVTVTPFMPPLFGHEKLASFEVYSYPALASYALGATSLLLALAIFLASRDAPWLKRADI